MLDPDVPQLINRLYNWKFASAAEHASDVQDELDHDDYELILALSRTFGNVGWFDGNLATIVRAAVATLIGEPE